jgi:predicted restriction endonuclease
MARRGQGRFKENVISQKETYCRITKVDRIEHLRASHIKPWRDSDNDERLDGENGLLLTPTIDHLFDRGFISFEDSGRLLISPVAHRPSLERMGVDAGNTVNVGQFSEGQRKHLDFHRNSVFLAAGNR